MTAAATAMTRDLRAERPARTLGLSDAAVDRAVTAVFCLFALRDTISGMGRYYLDRWHIGPLWFLAEAATVPVFAAFVWRWAIIRRSPVGVVLAINTLTASAITIVYMSWTPFQIMSSIKAFLPLFVGLMMAGRSVDLSRNARIALGIAFFTSLGGLVSYPYLQFPWVGQSIDNFGVQRQLTRVWWIGDQIRRSGFATDSTMAAFMTVFLYIILARGMRPLLRFTLLVPLFYAVHLSTSRTNMVVLSLFTFWQVLEAGVTWAQSLNAHRQVARWSFLCLFIPLLLIVLFSSVNLANLTPALYSMDDRIHHSWRLPFTYLAQDFPIGLLIGCGLGCYAYPMEYTERLTHWVPVDNFYMITYLMLGLPFLFVLANMILAPNKSVDRTKLMLMAGLNVYVTTVAAYGPSFAPLLIGYAFGDMLLPDMTRWKRRLTPAAGKPPTGGRPATAGNGLTPIDRSARADVALTVGRLWNTRARDRIGQG